MSMPSHEAVRQPAQSIQTAPMRIGIAGAGAFAVFLAESLAPLAACQLVAVAGRTPAKRQAVLNAWRSRRPPTLTSADPEPKVFDDARGLAVAEGVDAVLIATPPYLHAPLAEAAIAAGKHVLLEKPGALLAADLQRAADMARDRDRSLLVNLVMPHSPIVQAVQALLIAGALGPADMAVMHNQVHRVSDGHWFWDGQQSGGILVEHGVHFFEVGRRWFGQPVAWHAGAAVTEASHAAQVSQADAPVPARVWATVIHDGGGSRVPVHYYHGFVRPQEVPEDTAWQILCRYGRVNVYGWVPMRLEIEGTLPAALAPAVEQLLDALPLEPSIEAMAGFHDAVQALAQAGAAGERRGDEQRGDPAGATPAQPTTASQAGTTALDASTRVPVRRVVELRDRQGWYTALVQARFLDLLQAARQPGFHGLVTAEDAIADLALAEACTRAYTGA